MLFERTNQVFLLIACAMAGSGCQAPWGAPFSSQDKAGPTTAAVAPQPAVRLPKPEVEPPIPSTGDMTSVLDKLEQVRALDPAAEQKLREELRKAPSDQWPLVAEQFRASLAFHQQLVARDSKDSNATGLVTGYERDLLGKPQAELPQSSTTAFQQSVAKNGDRSSTPIGSLVDPHRANLDPAGSLAIAPPPPVSMPEEIASPTLEAKAPAEFAASGPAYPIPTPNSSDVKQSAYNVLPADAAKGAAQALATTPVDAAKTNSVAPSNNLSLAPASTNDESWQQLVQKAADDLGGRVVSSPATTAEVHQHVSLRMLRLLAGDTEKALEPIPHISPAEQDYWSRQIFALATYLDHHSQPDDKRRAAASVAHLDDAVSNLRELGSLSLRNLSFCKNVYGYGSIESYDTDVFAAGQQVSLYVEVENYHSKSTEKGYCTLLGATYELLDNKSKRVSGGDFPDVDDCCRSRRRDFHIQYGLSLPENLTPGRYRVELVIKDRQSDKLGHATAHFEVRSGMKK